MGRNEEVSPTSIAIADAKFGIMVGITAIISTSSFFFISQSLMSYFIKYGKSTIKS
jgi:hypothetical protein